MDRRSPGAFVTGFPIRHSRSPLIHGHWLKEHGIDGRYDAVEVAPQDFAAFIDRLRHGESAFVGGNVTLPHKEAAIALVDEADETAREIGAANTLWLNDGKVHATNTDGYGFLANLDAAAAAWDKDASARSAVVLGAGGASRAVILALRDRGFGTIHVVNRTPERAQVLADRFGSRIEAHRLDALAELLDGGGFFVNTSSLGMDGNDAPPIDFTTMAGDAVVTDIVYAPLHTPFLRWATAAGLRTVDGLGMLLHQAVPGFERWFGVRPNVSAQLRQVIVDDLEGER
nr:shikimate dehydrogenase [Pararhizobium haloflavum]